MSGTGGEIFRLSGAENAETGDRAERRFRVEVPVGSPLFEGHFPGHPILPGIAHLAIVERALGVTLAGVRSLKLRRPVGPGDALELRISPVNGEGWTGFELRRGEEPVSSGAVAASQTTRGWPAGGTAPLEETVPDPAFPAVETLLPHSPPARLLRGVIAAAPEEIVCAAEIPPLHPCAAGDRSPAFLGIETAAQAAAALEALNRPPGAGPRIGYLVGIREARFALPHLPAGQPLRVTVRRQGCAPPLAIYEIAVGLGSREAVTGTLSTFLAGSLVTNDRHGIDPGG